VRLTQRARELENFRPRPAPLGANAPGESDGASARPPSCRATSLAALPAEQREALGAGIPFPSRLGRPEEYASLVVEIVGNPMLNGETIRLDGALRMPPK
jgi:hypothetical protein